MLAASVRLLGKHILIPDRLPPNIAACHSGQLDKVQQAHDVRNALT
jgi:hypothetical protein